MAASEVVAMLLTAGANAAALTVFGDTPLHRVAHGLVGAADARAEIIDRLLDAGCPLNAVDTAGRTALWYAAGTGTTPWTPDQQATRFHVLQHLLDRGADPSRGGVGPAYGLFPLHRVDGRWRWEGDGAELTDLETLTRPFPHTDAFNPADGMPEPPEEEDFDSAEKFVEAEDAYWLQHEAVVFAPEHSIGLLYLCHLGCAYREALVITGPARGQMWADDTASDGGYRPLRGNDGNPIGFGRWYRAWLEKAEQHLHTDSSQNIL